MKHYERILLIRPDMKKTMAISCVYLITLLTIEQHSDVSQGVSFVRIANVRFDTS